MFAALTHRLKRPGLVLPVALFLYGCSDAPLPVQPRTLPTRPQALAGPTVIVANTDDAGAGSLRQAILDAPAGATIVFDAGIAGGIIVLSTGELTIDKALTIEGPVPAGMTISGGLSSRVFSVKSSGNALLRNLSIVNGRAKFGGGLDVEGTVILDHSLVANNEAVEAGGGGISVQLNGDVTLVNSTVSGNSAFNAGGGIVAIGTVSIRNSTIAFNTAGASDGGGLNIGNNATVSVRNSIIANNAERGPVAENANCDLGSNSLVLSGRNISNDLSCGPASATMLLTVANIGALADNGGPTKTHAILGGFAIDGGVQCSEATDQRYVVRNQGASCDIGAYEFNSFGTVAVTINPNASVNAKTGVMTVAGTISCSKSTSLSLDVRMSQSQKTTGRFTTIVEAGQLVSVASCDPSPSSWSAEFTPSTGKFVPGSATGTATPIILFGGFLATNVTATLKVFQVK